MVGIPYYSLACGCLLPDADEALGFSPDDAGNKKQQENIDYFFRYAGTRIERALKDSSFTEKITDAREMLLGEKTFLWDFPEFMPAPRKKATLNYCGPVEWNDWPYDEIDYAKIIPSAKPLAVVSFGTCNFSAYALGRVVKNLLALGYRVIAGTGGQSGCLKEISGHPDLQVVNMLPLKQVFARTSLLISHGGQLTIFSALRAQVPTLVMPFHPEQAHNAICLERIGCGKRLVDATFFYGKSEVYLAALEKMSDTQIKQRIRSLTEQTELGRNLSTYSNILSGYLGAATVADILDNEIQ
jgi:UDP:flavonoid glycosyltransferase YjiC (YdhE family)